jgi:thiol-disulfide isomerase/thioredoxin/YHS domain-containing protein
LGKMRNKTGLLGLIAAILLLPSAGIAQQTIRWETSLENAQRIAAQTNRLVLIHFWAPWCTVCKRMEVEVLSQPPVAAELAAHYVAVKINADNLRSTALQYGVSALPTTVIITPQGQVVDTMRGRVEAADLVARLSQVAAAARQRGAPVYAQVQPPPGGATTPVAQSPSSAAQIPMVGTRPPVMAGPSLTPPAQPSSVAANPPADNRYADYFQRGQAGSVTPIAQPMQSAGMSQPYPPQQQFTQPTSPMGQAPALASAAPAYGSRAPYPPPQQQLSPPAANQSMPSLASSQTPQVPAINPPLGLCGYCPVTLGEKQQWVLGDRRWGAVHRGRTYLFTGPEEQRRFFTDPDHYAPIISGNDVVLATEQGQPVPGMREHGVFFGNRVYLFSSEATLEKFARNPSLYASQAMGANRAGVNAGQTLQ